MPQQRTTKDALVTLESRACNFRIGGEGGPPYVVGPFFTLSDEEVQCAGRTIVEEWKLEIESQTEKMLAKHPQVRMVGEPDFDEGANSVFVDIGSEDPVALVACLREFSQYGYCTGIN